MAFECLPMAKRERTAPFTNPKRFSLAQITIQVTIECVIASFADRLTEALFRLEHMARRTSAPSLDRRLSLTEKTPMATTRKHKPIHPGEVLRLDFLEPMNVSAYRLAKVTGISAQQIGRILKGTRGISADFALRLARALGTSAQVWMGLQAQYDLDVAQEAYGRAIEKQVRLIDAA